MFKGQGNSEMHIEDGGDGGGLKRGDVVCVRETVVCKESHGMAFFFDDTAAPEIYTE